MPDQPENDPPRGAAREGVQHAPMPSPHDKRAPKWKGKSSQVHQFLWEFEVAAELAGLSEKEMRRQLGNYCQNPVDRQLLQSLPGYKISWEAFKKNILRMYPKGNPERTYTVDALDKFVNESRKSGAFTSGEDYARYVRDFLKSASVLEQRNHLLEPEKTRLFRKGWPKKTRRKIEAKLESTHPDVEDIYDFTFDQWISAVDYIMEKENRDAALDGENDSSSDSDSDSEEEGELRIAPKIEHKKRKKSPVKAIVKEEESEIKELLKQLDNRTMQSMNQVNQKFQALSQTVNESLRNHRGPAPRTSPPVMDRGPNEGAEPNRRRYTGCTFCGSIDGHYMQSCYVLMKYKEDGKVKLDPLTGRIIMGTGEMIPPTPYGTPLKHRVDLHIKSRQALYQSFTVDETNRTDETYPAMFVETYFTNPNEVAHKHPGEVSRKKEYDDWVKNDKDEDSMYELVYALDQYKRNKEQEAGGKNMPRTGARVNVTPKSILKKPTERPIPPETTPRIEEIAEDKVTEPKPTEERREIREVTKPFPGHNRATPIRQAYKSQAEDPELIDEVKEMVMSSNLTGLTVKHLLAVSPIIRATLVNKLRSQRVEVNHLLDLAPAFHLDNRIVGHKSLPLREIQVSFANGTKAMAVLDDGSSVIVVRHDLWREIGSVPLIQGESITLECADSSLSQTMGMLKNLPMKVGEIVLHVQAQVVKVAPYRLLLGRTFSALTGCTKHDDPNGDTLITITDPNNPRYKETLPTRPKLGDDSAPQESFFVKVKEQGKGSPKASTKSDC
jgi:hypothetical protein